jgi:hypothetical protein
MVPNLERLREAFEAYVGEPAVNLNRAGFAGDNLI